MRKLFVLLPLLLLVFATARTASADTVQLTGAGNTVWNGFPAGPYTATLNGNSIMMVCVSFDRHVSVGQTWQVTVNQLTEGGVANALYGSQTDALLKYKQAAWLYDQMSLQPNQRGDIQGAIWNTFTGTTPDTTGSNAWLISAQTQNFTGYDFSRFRILTPSNRTSNGPQENLIITQVPEPAALFLLGSGLVGIGSTLRKRHNARRDSKEV